VFHRNQDQRGRIQDDKSETRITTSQQTANSSRQQQQQHNNIRLKEQVE
jgi:hypothetical protein